MALGSLHRLWRGAALTVVRGVPTVTVNAAPKKGAINPDIAASLNTLAPLLRVQGDFDSASAVDAHMDRQHSWGVGAPETLKSLILLANFLKTNGRIPEAELLFRQALETCHNLHGDMHENTMMATSDLASILQDNGNLIAAEQLCQETLAICRHLFGDQNLDTLTAIDNYAFNLQAQGCYAKAAPLLSEALHIRTMMFGAKHFLVRRSKFILDGNISENIFRRKFNVECNIAEMYSSLITRSNHPFMILLLIIQDYRGRCDTAGFVSES